MKSELAWAGPTQSRQKILSDLDCGQFGARHYIMIIIQLLISYYQHHVTQQISTRGQSPSKPKIGSQAQFYSSSNPTRQNTET